MTFTLGIHSSGNQRSVSAGYDQGQDEEFVGLLRIVTVFPLALLCEMDRLRNSLSIKFSLVGCKRVRGEGKRATERARIRERTKNVT